MSSKIKCLVIMLLIIEIMSNRVNQENENSSKNKYVKNQYSNKSNENWKNQEQEQIQYNHQDKITSPDSKYQNQVQPKQTQYQDKVQSKEPQYHDKVQSKDLQYQDKVQSKEPVYQDKVQSKEPVYQDKVQSKETINQEKIQSKEPVYQDKDQSNQHQYQDKVLSHEPKRQDKVQSNQLQKQDQKVFSPVTLISTPPQFCKTYPNCDFYQVDSDLTNYNCSKCHPGSQLLPNGFCNTVSKIPNCIWETKTSAGLSFCQMCERNYAISFSNTNCYNDFPLRIKNCYSYRTVAIGSHVALICSRCNDNYTLVTKPDQTTKCVAGCSVTNCASCARENNVDYCLRCYNRTIGVTNEINEYYDRCLKCSEFIDECNPNQKENLN